MLQGAVSTSWVVAESSSCLGCFATTALKCKISLNDAKQLNTEVDLLFPLPARGDQPAFMQLPPDSEKSHILQDETKATGLLVVI